MNKEIHEKLEIPLFVEYDYNGKPKYTHKVSKSNNKYLVENIEKPDLYFSFDTVDQLHSDLLIGDIGERHSVDAFDDQTKENIFKNFPRRG